MGERCWVPGEDGVFEEWREDKGSGDKSVRRSRPGCGWRDRADGSLCKGPGVTSIQLQKRVSREVIMRRSLNPPAGREWTGRWR